MEMSVPERARGKGVNASIRRERGRERERALQEVGGSLSASSACGSATT
jgi:hypothetical protein